MKVQLIYTEEQSLCCTGALLWSVYWSKVRQCCVDNNCNSHTGCMYKRSSFFVTLPASV